MLLWGKARRSEMAVLDLLSVSCPDRWDRLGEKLRQHAGVNANRYEGLMFALRLDLYKILAVHRAHFSEGPHTARAGWDLLRDHARVFVQLIALDLAPLLIRMGREKSRTAIPGHVKAATALLHS